MTTMTSTNTIATTGQGRSDRDRLALLQATYTQLLAATRACVAAEQAGEADPVGYVRDLLADNGQLPAAGARPSQLLADTSCPQDNPVHEKTFAGRAESVREVRAFVAELLAGCPRADDAVLCASELATNALLHTASGQVGGCFTVRLQVCGQVCVRITVADQGAPAHGPDVRAHQPHVPAHSPSVPAHVAHTAPAPAQVPAHAPAPQAAPARPAGEGGYGLPLVRALAGGEPGGPGLCWNPAPGGGVVSCTLAWPAAEQVAR